MDYGMARVNFLKLVIGVHSLHPFTSHLADVSGVI
jgi:hypothetical protein